MRLDADTDQFKLVLAQALMLSMTQIAKSLGLRLDINETHRKVFNQVLVRIVDSLPSPQDEDLTGGKSDNG